MTAAHLSSPALVLEGNEKAGKKIYITGKGRCNLTNLSENFFSNIVRGSKFLLSSVNAFPPAATCEFFEENGLKLKTERGERIFPSSDKASDVTKILLQAAELHKFLYGERVESVKKTTDGYAVKTQNAEYSAQNVVFATGGMTYPSTGSDGFGYSLCRALGHTVTKCVPSLTAFLVKEDVSTLKGLSFKYVTASAVCYCDKKQETISESGELLFTDRGISGPIVLKLSALAAKKSTTRITIDFKPQKTDSEMDKSIQEYLQSGKTQLKNIMEKLLPRSLSLFILLSKGLNPEKTASSVTAAERMRLIDGIKRLELTFDVIEGFNQAVVTCGGVALGEINPKTMESKLHEGLYIVGELLDADAFTGGYNLQIAWSTAYAAAMAINAKNTSACVKENI